MREDLVPHQIKISLPASRRNTWDKSRELPTVSTLRVRGEREREREREREGVGERGRERDYIMSANQLMVSSLLDLGMAASLHTA